MSRAVQPGDSPYFPVPSSNGANGTKPAQSSGPSLRREDYCPACCVGLLAILALGLLYLRVTTWPTGEPVVGYDFGTHYSWWCPGPSTLNGQAVAAPVVDKYLGGYPYLGWWNMQQPQTVDFLAAQRAKLSPYDLGPKPPCTGEPTLPCTYPASPTLHSVGNALDVMRAMYAATRVPGVIESVPNVLQGVFWMKGNGLAEELVTMQYGRWFPDVGIHIYSKGAPFAWAWPVAGPKVTNISAVNLDAWSQTLYAESHSFVLGKCPPQARYCDEAAKVTSAPFSYGHFQSFGPFGGNLYQPSISSASTTYSFTLEMMAPDGSHWKRGIYFGVGGCTPIEAGSYDLVKVLDSSGNPVEPYYSEFVQYINGVPLMVLSGWPDEGNRQDWKGWIESVTFKTSR